MSYTNTIYDNANNVRIKKYAERQKQEQLIQKRDDNIYDNAAYHKKKEGIADELVTMFQDKFKVNRDDFFLMIDRFHIMDVGLTRDVLVKVVGELKLLSSHNNKINEKAHMYSNMNLEYSPNLDNDKPNIDIPSFYAPSNIKNKSEFEYEKQAELESSTPLDQLLDTPKINNTIPTPISMSIPIKKKVSIDIPKETIKKPELLSNNKVEIKSKKNIKITEPNTFIISYPNNNTIEINEEKIINYNGSFISLTACNRYNLDQMPYLLLVINKKYKIPIDFKKLNNQFYAHKKIRGPMIVNNEIMVELYDYMNNPLNINLMPTEIFHILFETTTQ
jgi:hypothetical protein